MKFIVSSRSLSDSLSMVTHALPARSTMESLEGVLIKAQENQLKLTCSDGILSIEHVISAQVSIQGAAIAPGRLLFEAVRRLPDSDCAVEMNENYALSLRCAGNRTKIAGNNADEYPNVAQLIDPRSMNISSVLLKKMILSTVFCAAQDDNRPILTGCLFKADSYGIKMVALDGFRMAVYEADGGVSQPIEAVIPWKSLNEVARILPDEDQQITLHVTDSYFAIDMPSTRITLRLLEGKYIDYRKILPQDFKTIVIVEKKCIEDAVSRAALMAREAKTYIIRLKIEDEYMTITANAEMGDVYEELPINLNGLEMQAAFNVKYITDAIRGIDAQRIVLKMNTNVTPCVIIPEDTAKGALYLMLPVRVN